MGIGLSLATVFEIARVTVPTFGEALVGRVTRDKCDQRLDDFARRVIERARIQLEVVGADDLPAERAFVYMSNHQSHMDIPVLYATIPARTLRMVAKAELFRVPLFGRSMRAAGMIEVDRKNRAQAVASLERASAAIASGVSVWIAPEGTRSTTGEIGPLKKGGFRLAVDTGTPIVPVAIRGTRNILPPGASGMRPDVPVRVVYGRPTEVADRPLSDLMDEVRDFLVRNSRAD